MEWQRPRQAAPGECALASIGRRVSAHPLEGLEPEAASTSVYATPSSPTRGGASRTEPSCRSNAPTCASVSGAAGALSADVSRTVGSQCSRFHSWAGDCQMVWRPSRLCCLARFSNSLTFALESQQRFPFLGQMLLRVEPCGLFSQV